MISATKIATGIAGLMNGPIGPPGLIPIIGPSGDGPGYVTPEEAIRRGATYEIGPSGERAWNLTTVRDYSVGSVALTPGSHIEAQRSDGTWKGATVLDHDSTSANVLFDGDAAPTWVVMAAVRTTQAKPDNSGAQFMGGKPNVSHMDPVARPVSRLPNVGDHVDAQWTNGKWYGANVLEITEQDGVRVAWDDGTAPSWLMPNQVRPFTGPHMDPVAPQKPVATAPTKEPSASAHSAPSNATPPASASVMMPKVPSGSPRWVLPTAAAAFVGAGVAFWQAFRGSKAKK